MSIEMIFLVWICVLFSLVIGYLSGKYSEREKWNDLIDKGIIPKPNIKK